MVAHATAARGPFKTPTGDFPVSIIADLQAVSPAPGLVETSARLPFSITTHRRADAHDTPAKP